MSEADGGRVAVLGVEAAELGGAGREAVVDGGLAFGAPLQAPLLDPSWGQGRWGRGPGSG